MEVHIHTEAAMFKKTLSVALTSFALLVGATGSSIALLGPVDNGAGARAWADGNPDRFVYARDTSCDAQSVNADYVQATGVSGTLNNPNGCGTTRESQSLAARVDSIRACTVRPALPDNCSGWIHRP